MPVAHRPHASGKVPRPSSTATTHLHCICYEYDGAVIIIRLCHHAHFTPPSLWPKLNYPPSPFWLRGSSTHGYTGRSRGGATAPRQVEREGMDPKKLKNMDR